MKTYILLVGALTLSQQIFCVWSWNSKDSGSFINFSKISFDNVRGMPHQKKILQTWINRIKSQDHANTQNAHTNICVLYGPTRTGKSFIASAFEGEIQKEVSTPVSFVHFTGYDILTRAEKLYNWLSENKQPCVMVIDDIESVVDRRLGGSPLLLKNFFERIQIIQKDSTLFIGIIATLNTSTNIGKTALQNLPTTVQILGCAYPSEAERYAYLTDINSLFCLNIADEELKTMAINTQSCSFSDIERLMKEHLRKRLLETKFSPYTPICACPNEI